MPADASDRPSPLPPVDFLGCPLHPMTTGACIALAAQAAARPVGSAPLRVAYLNAHTSNLASRTPALRDALRRCGLVYADGQAVVWAARLLGAPVPERVNAGDFIVWFCAELAARDASLYLLGGAPGVAERAAREWQRLAPGLRIAGTHDGYFADDDSADIARAVGESGAGVVLVGMGSPRQEEWMDRWGGETGARVVWCVGALFEYYAGGRRRAPVWMRRCGLEWLFRLALEPGRLWRRYLVGNTRFCLRVARAWMRFL